MKTRYLFLTGLLTAFAVPAVAVANEGAVEAIAADAPLSVGEVIAQSPIMPALAEFIPMLIAFLILLFVMGKYAWPMFMQALDARAESIEGSLRKAEEAKVEAEGLVSQYQAKLAEARKEAAEILEAARKAGEAARADIVAKSNIEAAAIIERAHAATEAEKRAAAAELEGKVGEFAVAIAAKLIGEKISPEADAKLIDRYLAEMGSFNDN